MVLCPHVQEEGLVQSHGAGRPVPQHVGLRQVSASFTATELKLWFNFTNAGPLPATIALKSFDEQLRLLNVRAITQSCTNRNSSHESLYVHLC